MSTKQRERLHSLTGAEGQYIDKGNSSEIQTNEPIEFTPFRCIGNPEKGYFVAMGQYQITELFETQELAVDALEANKWTVMINIMTIIIQMGDAKKHLDKMIGEQK